MARVSNELLFWRLYHRLKSSPYCLHDLGLTAPIAIKDEAPRMQGAVRRNGRRGQSARGSIQTGSQAYSLFLIMRINSKKLANLTESSRAAIESCEVL